MRVVLKASEQGSMYAKIKAHHPMATPVVLADGTHNFYHLDDRNQRKLVAVAKPVKGKNYSIVWLIEINPKEGVNIL